ncbi:MAG: high-potential iron-sulfur protein [Pseudomonadales bacterium]
MINRRRFVQISSVAAAASLTHRAQGAEPLPDLPADNPQAIALRYVADVSANPPEGYPAGSGQDCTNCIHYKGLDDTFGSCALFPTYKVHAAGWCAGWVKGA